MDQEEDLDSDKSQSQATSSSTDPSLSRNLSLSKLNAQAPAFVPTRNPTSRLDPSPHQQPQQQRLAIPPPPMVHAYPPAAGASPTHPPPPPPFHVPLHGPVRVPTLPIQDHHSQHHNNQRSHHRHQNHYHHHSHHHQYAPVHYAGQDQYHGIGVGEQEVEISTKKGHQPTQAQGEQNHGGPPSRNGVSEEAAQKILNQVEYYFSDLNLATTDHLMRCISKDPEGYVPISVVASFKKIKALVNSNSQLATVLRTSPKLVVSEDGKKVRRQHLLTESDMEELQSRIVLAENLPEDHCHQNLMKIFSSIGSVKTIRTCQPQASSGGTSSASRSAKADGMHYSNKLHAFVEYESVELAEKAVAELNDEGNWRSGLRVCLMLKRTTKSAQARGKKVNDGEGHYEEEDTSTSDLQTNDKQAGDSSPQLDVHSHDHAGEGHVNDKDGVPKKGRNRGQGKGRGRTQYQQNNRGHHIGTPPSNNMVFNEQQMAVKQPPGPRMPDGTRGFAMGRGKPVAVNTE